VSGNVPQLHPTEEAAALTPAAGAGLAALLTSHVLRDGELVLLTLKPSLLFIPLQSLRFAVIAGFFALLGVLANGRIDQGDRLYIEIAVILVACRLMVASLQWMGRLYVLTDQRILRLAGVFSTDLFDCPLRKVAEARLTDNVREQLLGLGSIEIIPCDDRRLPSSWQTIARPKKIHAKVLAAITRAKQ
jgi:hypothetical protein